MPTFLDVPTQAGVINLSQAHDLDATGPVFAEPALIGASGRRYSLGSRVTCGSHAWIHAGRRDDLLAVAIKRLNSLSGYPVGQFSQEGLLHSRLTGVPGLLPLLDTVQVQGQPALVFPWRSRTLEAMGGQPWDELRPLLAQLARCLIAMHGQGVVHRDVSPANILLNEGADNSLGMEVELADLGLAIDLGESFATSAAISIWPTPGFHPPASLAHPGPAMDSYGLAATAWWLVTGSVPVTGAGGRSLPSLYPGVNPLSPSGPPNLLEDIACWLNSSAPLVEILPWLDGRCDRLVPERQRWLPLGSLASLILLQGMLVLLGWMRRWLNLPG